MSDPFKVMVMSDLHFSYQVTDQKLDAIVRQVKNLAPKYILMPGDLVDTLDMVDSEAELNRFLNFLSSLGQLATVITTCIVSRRVAVMVGNMVKLINYLIKFASSKMFIC